MSFWCQIGLHKLECQKDTYIHKYYECQRDQCDHREVRKVAGGHQPVDRHWIETGEWEQPDPPSYIPVQSVRYPGEG